mgnify:CR=1 FL=1
MSASSGPGRGRAWQALRRAVQASVLLFIAYGAMGGIWRNYKVAHNSARLVRLMEGETWGTLYALNERALSAWGGEPYRASFDFVGLPWSATVAGVHTADPILVASHALQTGTAPWSLWLGLLVPLGLAALLGKVFCSHLCPMRLVFDLGQMVRGGLLLLRVPLPQVRLPARLGGWVLLGGLLASLGAGTVVWLWILPYVGLAAGLFLVITSGGAAGLLTVVVFWAMMDALVAPGQFCHALCPTGWLLEQVGRRRLLRLTKAAEPACPTGCTACERACPYALSPKNLTHLPACDNCGQCVPACPDRKLVRRLGVPSALTLTLLALGLSAPGAAEAHHNKGLPHYGYFDNYPQVPTEEHVVVDGDWEIGATIFNFQGLDRRSADTPNDVKVYAYLYDLAHDRAYEGPVTFEILLDDVVVTRFARTAADEEMIYVTRETLPESGDYTLRARVPGVDRPLDLNFAIELSDELSWGLIFAMGVPVLLVFVLAVLGRTRRGRARLHKARAASGAAVTVALLPALLPAMARAAPVDCADPGSISAAVIDAHGQVTMIMQGMPPALFVLGLVLVIVASFVVVERVGTRPASPWRFNLMKHKRIYAIVRNRWFQVVPQLALVGVLCFLLYVGLTGSRVRNLMPVAVWTVWWGGLIFMIALAGPLFCFACPWDGLANLLSRVRIAARVEPLSLGLTPPAWLRTMYPAIVLFVLLSWAELGLSATTDPRRTAYMGLGMVALAVLFALLFDGKTFCRNVCPVGRISGVYANFSPLEVRARNPRSCRTCTTEDCLNGNERGYPCPVGISLKTVADSTDCTFCTECVKSCDRQNVALNLRPFGTDLHAFPASEAHAPRRDAAWMALVLLALTLFHGLSMTTTWHDPLPGRPSILKWMTVHWGTGEVFNFTVGMAAAMAIPIALYASSCWVAARLTRASGVSAGVIFGRYAFALLPIALFYHLAHNAMHVLMEGGGVVPLLSDPFGDGRDWFGTAALHIGHLVSESTLWTLQLALVLVGHVFGVVVAHRISRRLFADRRQALLSLVPMTAVMVLVSVAGLSLMAVDMSMRMGRM